MTTSRHILILSAAFLFTLAVRAEAPPVVRDSPAWAVSGTTITVQSDRVFERGVLRIVGPDGYRAVKRFTGGSVALDLLADGRLEIVDRENVEDGAPSAAGKTESTAPADRPPLASLPDGAYRCEVVLSGPGGTSRSHYLARSRSGSLSAGPVVSSPSSAESLASIEGSVSTTGGLVQGQFAELVEILDENDSGITALDLQADDVLGAIVEEWRLENRSGDLRVVEKNDGSGDFPRMTILQDRGRAQIGLGTTAPATLLHLASDTTAPPRIRIEDNYDGVDDYWDLRVANGVEGLARAFSILDSDGDRQFLIYEGAPNLALEIDATEVRVGTNLAVLSSREAKQNLTPIDSTELLARLEELPIFEWEYREAGGVRHLGPTAEEFRQQFALGSSDRTLSPTDLGGVALAAIQGLQKELERQRVLTRDRLDAKTREIERLRAERLSLEARLEKLEEQMSELPEAQRDRHGHPGPVSGAPCSVDTSVSSLVGR